MSKIGLVTDSTCDLGQEGGGRIGVTVVPLNVHFGDEVFLDGVSLTPETFFPKLESSRVMPRTSQPSPGDFVEVYRRLAGQGYDQILSIHISAALSGTYQSADIARTMVTETHVTVIDSKTASLGLGLMVIDLAERIEAGEPMESLLARIERMKSEGSLYFGVATLEYLEKNGRIGRAQGLLGTLLNVKPILTLVDGVVSSFDKVRGKKKVIPRLIELITDRVPPSGQVRCAVVHGNVPDEAEDLAAALGELYGQDPLIYMIGPVIGCHTGPGLLGVMALPAD